jgi:hypothetical protein
MKREIASSRYLKDMEKKKKKRKRNPNFTGVHHLQ